MQGDEKGYHKKCIPFDSLKIKDQLMQTGLRLHGIRNLTNCGGIDGMMPPARRAYAPEGKLDDCKARLQQKSLHVTPAMTSCSILAGLCKKTVLRRI